MKKSSYELPKELEFKAGDQVFSKEEPDKQWTILGFSSTGKVRLIGPDGPLDVSAEELKEHFVQDTKHALEDLVA